MAIARIALARSLARIIALPVVLLVLAGGAAAAGLLVTQEALAIGFGAVAAVLVLAALALPVIPLTLRLEVEVGGLRVRWLFGSHRFRLVPGAVTRAGMSGERAAIRTGLRGAAGWIYGRTLLRGEEPIWIVRLAGTESVILVPTDAGRVAIAAASEAELLEGLAAASRVQQRLDEAVGHLPAISLPLQDTAPWPVVGAASDAAEAVADDDREAEPHVLTGIERARLEEELAAAREAALRAAEEERRALVDAQPAAGAPPADPARPLPDAVAPAEPYDVERAAPRTAPSLARRRIRGTWTRPAWALPGRVRVLGTVAWSLAPLLASLAAYALLGSGRLTGVDVTSKLQILALVACGPLTALGVLMARTWWPRLSGLVTLSSVMALVLLVRTVAG